MSSIGPFRTASNQDPVGRHAVHPHRVRQSYRTKVCSEPKMRRSPCIQMYSATDTFASTKANANLACYKGNEQQTLASTSSVTLALLHGHLCKRTENIVEFTTPCAGFPSTSAEQRSSKQTVHGCIQVHPSRSGWRPPSAASATHTPSQLCLRQVCSSRAPKTARSRRSGKCIRICPTSPMCKDALRDLTFRVEMQIRRSSRPCESLSDCDHQP